MSEIPIAMDVADSAESSAYTNGVKQEAIDEVSLDILQRELPVVYNDQIPLGDLLQRVMQTIYAELTEMAETYAFFRPLVKVRCLTRDIITDFLACRMWLGNGRWQTGW